MAADISAYADNGKRAELRGMSAMQVVADVPTTEQSRGARVLISTPPGCGGERYFVMRAKILAWFSVVALVASAAAVSAQTPTVKEREQSATGQSERPKDPKHIEPESSSHNADKPTKQDDPAKPKSGAETPTQTPPKKNPG